MMTSDSSPKIRHEWFQTDEFVTISVFVKKLAPETLKVEFGSRSLGIRFPSPSSSSEVVLDWDPLFLGILPAECVYEVLSTKIEIKLKKKKAGIKWNELDGDASVDEDGVTAVIMSSLDQQKPPEYPSSSKKKLDWNKVEKTVQDEKPEGEQALNALFQQIFRDGDENTKRAMMKSFVESNGTCLSTNWNEVGTKKVDVTPPEGMVAKKFEL